MSSSFFERARTFPCRTMTNTRNFQCWKIRTQSRVPAVVCCHTRERKVAWCRVHIRFEILYPRPLIATKTELSMTQEAGDHRTVIVWSVGHNTRKTNVEEKDGSFHGLPWGIESWWHFDVSSGRCGWYFCFIKGSNLQKTSPFGNILPKSNQDFLKTGKK